MRVFIDNSTSFQSAVKFDKNMSKSEKEYAKAILKTRLWHGSELISNKALLKKYDLNLEFLAPKNRLTAPGIGYRPYFNILEKDKTSNKLYKKFECGAGWQGDTKDIYAGAIKLKQVINIANQVKISPRYSDRYKFTDFWQLFKGILKGKIRKIKHIIRHN